MKNNLTTEQMLAREILALPDGGRLRVGNYMFVKTVINGETYILRAENPLRPYPPTFPINDPPLRHHWAMPSYNFGVDFDRCLMLACLSDDELTPDAFVRLMKRCLRRGEITSDDLIIDLSALIDVNA